MSDHDFEPIPGLPAELPPGERVVWQGRPRTWALAARAFKARWIGGYLFVLVALRALFTWMRGTTSLDVVLALALASFCFGVVLLMAFLHARTTLYTITTRRVVMRVGVAMPITWNLPFSRIASADLEVRREGDGDLVLRLAPPDKLPFAILWPHAHDLVRAQPALRGLQDPAAVAQKLASAVKAWARENDTALTTTREAAPKGAMQALVVPS